MSQWNTLNKIWSFIHYQNEMFWQKCLMKNVVIRQGIQLPIELDEKVYELLETRLNDIFFLTREPWDAKFLAELGLDIWK